MPGLGTADAGGPLQGAAILQLPTPRQHSQGNPPCLGESFLCHHKQLQGPQYGPGLKPRRARPKKPNVPRRGSSARSWGTSLSLLDDEDVTNVLVTPNFPIANTHSRHIISVGRAVDIRPRVDPNILMEQLLLWSWAIGVALANPMHSRPDLWSRQVDGAVSENVFLRRAYHSCQYISVLVFTLTCLVLTLESEQLRCSTAESISTAASSHIRVAAGRHINTVSHR